MKERKYTKEEIINAIVDVLVPDKSVFYGREARREFSLKAFECPYIELGEWSDWEECYDDPYFRLEDFINDLNKKL